MNFAMLKERQRKEREAWREDLGLRVRLRFHRAA